jgi:deoxyhypusine synthase
VAAAVVFADTPSLIVVGGALTKQAVAQQMQCEHAMDLAIRRTDGMPIDKYADVASMALATHIPSRSIENEHKERYVSD